MRLLPLILFFGTLFGQAAHAQYLPPGADTWYVVPEDGIPQYVVEFGRGDTVVVVHGGFGAEHSYLIDPLLPLADRYHFVLYDQRGSLRSPAPDSLISLDAFVSDLETLRRQLGLDQLVVLTHSMGAATAYAYLARHPDRVRGLALTGPALPVWTDFLDRPPADPRIVPAADSAAAAERFQRYYADLDRRIAAEIEEEGLPDPRMFTLESLGGAPPGTHRAITYHQRVRYGAVNLCDAARWREVRGNRAFFNPDVITALAADSAAYRTTWDSFLPAFESFEGSVAVVIGDCDYIDPEAVLWPRLTSRLPNAETRVIRDAGHLFWVDRPAASTEALVWALRYAFSTADR